MHDLKRRITYLMLVRVVSITLVLGLTVAFNLAEPSELAAPGNVILFIIVGATYALTLLYAYFLPRVAEPMRFADGQLVGDLVITTLLVYATGGAQSPYAFFFPLSIVGGAILRHRRGALLVAAVSVMLLITVAVIPERPVPVQQLLLNIGACIAIGVLSALLGGQLAQSSERLEVSRQRAADLAALKEHVVRCLTSGLATVDGDGRIMTFNGAAAEILRLAPEEAVGRPIADIVPGVETLIAGLGRRDSLRRGETRTRLDDGRQLSLGVSISPLMNHKDEPIGRIVNFQDLTELRRMEVQVKRAERLAVIGGVAAAVAHEIRNPLASISGSCLLYTSPSPRDS